MLEENNIPKDNNSEASTQDNSKVKNSRRSFLTKAVITGPIITSVASRPVWGAGICSLSGSLSGNLSNHGEQSSCDGPIGRSPGFWSKWEKITSCKGNQQKTGRKRLYQWAQTPYSPLDSFSGIFGASPVAGYSDTLGAVMRTGAGTDSFDRHVIAALLSSTHSLMIGLVPYTAAQVIQAFQIVNSNPGTQQATDIIQIFDSLFNEHEEVSLGNQKVTLTDAELAALCNIIGKTSPRAAGACD